MNEKIREIWNKTIEDGWQNQVVFNDEPEEVFMTRFANRLINECVTRIFNTRCQSVLTTFDQSFAEGIKFECAQNVKDLLNE
mgnify:FL=1